MKNKKKFYLLSLLIFIFGGIFFVIFVYRAYTNLGDAIVQGKFPGVMTKELKDVGNYSIYHEHLSLFEGKRYNNIDLDLSNIIVQVIYKKDGENIVLIVPSSRKNYSYKGRKATELYHFKVENAGEYVFKADLIKNDRTGDFILAIEKDFGLLRSKNVLKAEAAFMVPFIISILIFIVTYSRK